jgi:hypothetical protein
LVALIAGYTFTGFDQPFFLSQRLFGFGIVVPQHWLAWHLPSLGLLLTMASLAVLLITPSEDGWASSSEPRRPVRAEAAG